MYLVLDMFKGTPKGTPHRATPAYSSHYLHTTLVGFPLSIHSPQGLERAPLVAWFPDTKIGQHNKTQLPLHLDFLIDLVWDFKQDPCLVSNRHRFPIPKQIWGRVTNTRVLKSTASSVRYFMQSLWALRVVQELGVGGHNGALQDLTNKATGLENAKSVARNSPRIYMVHNHTYRHQRKDVGNPPRPKICNM